MVDKETSTRAAEIQKEREVRIERLIKTLEAGADKDADRFRQVEKLDKERVKLAKKEEKFDDLGKKLWQSTFGGLFGGMGGAIPEPVKIIGRMVGVAFGAKGRIRKKKKRLLEKAYNRAEKLGLDTSGWEEKTPEALEQITENAEMMADIKMPKEPKPKRYDPIGFMLGKGTSGAPVGGVPARQREEQIERRAQIKKEDARWAKLLECACMTKKGDGEKEKSTWDKLKGILIALAAAVAALTIAKNIKTVTEKLKEFWSGPDWLPAWMTKPMNELNPQWADFVPDALERFWKGEKADGTSFLPTWMTKPVGEMWGDLSTTITNFWNGVDKDNKSFLPTWMTKPVGELWGDLSTTITNFWQGKRADQTSFLPTWMTKPVGELWGDLSTTITRFWEGKDALGNSFLPTWMTTPVGELWGDFSTRVSNFWQGKRADQTSFLPTWMTTPTGEMWGDFNSKLHNFWEGKDAQGKSFLPPWMTTPIGELINNALGGGTGTQGKGGVSMAGVDYGKFGRDRFMQMQKEYGAFYAGGEFGLGGGRGRSGVGDTTGFRGPTKDWGMGSITKGAVKAVSPGLNYDPDDDWSNVGAVDAIKLDRRAQAIYGHLVGRGVPSTHAWGMVANIERESSFNPAAVNPTSGAVGLFQYLGSRKTAFETALPHWQGDVVGQLNYALAEDPKDSRIDKYFGNAYGSVSAAAVGFNQTFERAGSHENAPRAEIAKKYDAVVAQQSTPKKSSWADKLKDNFFSLPATMQVQAAVAAAALIVPLISLIGPTTAAALTLGFGSARLATANEITPNPSINRPGDVMIVNSGNSSASSVSNQVTNTVDKPWALQQPWNQWNRHGRQF